MLNSNPEDNAVLPREDYLHGVFGGYAASLYNDYRLHFYSRQVIRQGAAHQIAPMLTTVVPVN